MLFLTPSSLKKHFSRGENYIKNLHPKNKIILSSFPRCGNTALRLSLSQALQQRKVVVSEIDRVTIDPYASTKSNINKIIEKENSIIKWHGFPMPFHAFNKIIYIYRNPIDTCRSYYTYQKYRHQTTQLTPREYIKQFTIDGDPSYGRWDHHILAWKGLCEMTGGVLIDFDTFIVNPSIFAKKIKSNCSIDVFDEELFLDSLSSCRSSAKKNKGADFFKSTIGHKDFNMELENLSGYFDAFNDLYGRLSMT